MKFSAVLLAGGESRRMGTDKATLPVRGKPLWEIQLATLRALAPAELFLSARTDPPWRPSDVAFVPDTSPSRGPLSGMAAAMAAATCELLVVLAIDMPRMRADYLQQLVTAAGPELGVIPERGDHLEPLAAVYPAAAREAIEFSLEKNELSLQAVCRSLISKGHLKTRKECESAETLFLNLNSVSHLRGLTQ